LRARAQEGGIVVTCVGSVGVDSVSSQLRQ
jgi:hypothetical protein